MAMLKGFKGVFVAVCFVVLVVPATYAQPQIPTIPTTSPCTNSMISSFTPCVNFLTNSTSSGTSPTTGCCNALRSLMSNGTDCLCQIVTGGVPFQFPINRTTAVSLPRACNQPGVPIQCKAAPGAPVPAPGPVAFGPSASPTGAVSPSPSIVGTVPTAESPALSPGSDSNPTLTPPSTEAGSFPPTTTSAGSTPGSTSSLNPSSAMPLSTISPAVLLISIAVMFVKLF